MPYLRATRARALPYVAAAGAVLAGLAISGGQPTAQGGNGPRVIEITARRFGFEPSEIEATVGERLQFVVRSADGVHGLEIKRFKVKKEVPRGGQPVTIDFTPTSEGRFPILCSEYCGDGHADMTGMLVVHGVERDTR